MEPTAVGGKKSQREEAPARAFWKEELYQNAMWHIPSYDL
jgi:hypothetical protein